jgi:uncharacterized membrane protein
MVQGRCLVNLYELSVGILAMNFGFLILGYTLGWRRGYKRGRDEQWLDIFFSAIERQKNRRDDYGRFKKISFSN